MKLCLVLWVFLNLTYSIAGGGTGISWLSSIYDPHGWTASSVQAQRLLSGQCRSNMKIYLNNLNNGTLWANIKFYCDYPQSLKLKMAFKGRSMFYENETQETTEIVADSSGKYSSEFFYGNELWMGSKTECLRLNTLPEVQPPFRATYQTAMVNVTLPQHLMPKWKLITLGLCLPEGCSGSDVKLLGEGMPSIPSPAGHHLHVVRVRPVPGNYSPWTDPTLHILSTVVVLVLGLMISGTLLEAKMERKQRKMATNNNTQHMDPQSPQQLAYKRQLELSGDTPNQGVGKLQELVLCFSVIGNGRKLLGCQDQVQDEGHRQLTSIHGLRFFSIIWVILVHTYLQIFAIAENKQRRSLAEQSVLFQTVSNATFSVDTFFFISGLLVCYLYLKSSGGRGDSKPKGDVQPALRTPKPFLTHLRNMSQKFLVLLGYRFIRLTPAYMFVLGLAELSMRYVKKVSVFDPVSLDDVNCSKYWWRNMLYINSLFPRSQMCMLWSWYMANDTQFYVLGILLLLISSRYFRLAVSGLVLVLVSSWVTTALISVKYNYIVRVDEPFQAFDELYDKPWLRVGPYLVGMFTGWFLQKSKFNIRISKFTVVTGWSLSLLTLSGLVYGVLGAKLQVTGSAVYNSIGHTAWGAALSWIVIACCTGYGGIVDNMLSFRMLQPLSRLTYCAYLIHPVMMAFTIFQTESAFHLNQFIVIPIYLGNIVGSFILSFFISLSFEAPVVRLLKLGTNWAGGGPHTRRHDHPDHDHRLHATPAD